MEGMVQRRSRSDGTNRTLPIDMLPIDTLPIDMLPIDTLPIDTLPIDTGMYIHVNEKIIFYIIKYGCVLLYFTLGLTVYNYINTCTAGLLKHYFLPNQDF